MKERKKIEIDITGRKPQSELLKTLLADANLCNLNRKPKANYIQVPISNIKLIAEVNQISIDDAIELVREYFNAGLIKECDNWKSVKDELPKKEGYYRVRFSNGEEDEKPFRIRPSKNIYGFMTEDEVTHWAFID